MKRMMVFGFSLLLLMMNGLLYAATGEAEQRYKFTFNKNDVYDITIGLKHFVWKGLSGEEKGKSDVVTNFKRTKISNSVEVMTWNGNYTSAFNVIVVDHDKLKAIAIGKVGDEAWFWHGTMVRMPINSV